MDDLVSRSVYSKAQLYDKTAMCVVSKSNDNLSNDSRSFLSIFIMLSVSYATSDFMGCLIFNITKALD